jgi:hypothetical protein
MAMIRLILFFFLVAAVALALASVMVMLRSGAAAIGGEGPVTMTKPVQRVTFVLLMVLMLGVVTGWLGAV